LVLREVRERAANSRTFKVGDLEFGRVREFKHLGSTLTEDSIAIQIKQRIVMANPTSYDLKKQLNSRYFGREANLRNPLGLYLPMEVRSGPWKGNIEYKF
jgi:hypothetical protein